MRQNRSLLLESVDKQPIHLVMTECCLLSHSHTGLNGGCQFCNTAQDITCVWFGRTLRCAESAFGRCLGT